MRISGYLNKINDFLFGVETYSGGDEDGEFMAISFGFLVFTIEIAFPK